MMKKLLSHFDEFEEIVGWMGTFFILAAYFLVSFDLLSAQDLIYQLLNLVGAFGIVVISFKKKAYPPGVLNLIWLLIALFAILSSFL